MGNSCDIPELPWDAETHDPKTGPLPAQAPGSLLVVLRSSLGCYGAVCLQYDNVLVCAPSALVSSSRWCVLDVVFRMRAMVFLHAQRKWCTPRTEMPISSFASHKDIADDGGDRLTGAIERSECVLPRKSLLTPSLRHRPWLWPELVCFQGAINKKTIIIGRR